MSRTVIEISRCPLHVHKPLAKETYQFLFKPSRAGVRILSLDGGGVGALVELCVLRSVQKVLGPKLTVQKFFDLIVGTSAGGLGARGWSVDEAASKFKGIVKEIFGPRDIHRVPFLKGVTDIFHGSRYKTQTLENVLKREFSNKLLFGGGSSFHQISKVAVTSSSILGKQTTISANYNRFQDENHGIGYDFLRPDTPIEELKIWEAARATFALPRYFKSFHFMSFHKVETHGTYVDDTENSACPAWVAHQEARLIWHDMAIEPDIFLSIGIGRNVRNSTLQQHHRLGQRVDSIETISEKLPQSLFLGPVISEIRSGEKTRNIDTEKMWDEFIARTMTHDESLSVGDGHRYIRMNPG
ncbi:acyl transferase/acyl hydrolase/lysophospholipase [Xylaria sp. FL0064]|nr:acyl transferase/acyl hydrolase/lysophospholipase [Xylaria sp. FL0064]